MRKLIESTFISLDGDDRINSMPKYVASTTMEATSHPWNATLLEGEAADAVAALKAEPGQGLLKFGTGSFTRTLLEHRLIDELHLWRFRDREER